MSVESSHDGLDHWSLKESDVGCGLPWLNACLMSEGVDESEGINDDLSSNGLNGVDDNCDTSGIEHLKGLLGLDVCA